MGARLAEENRILSRDWNLYDQCHTVFKPACMSAEELAKGFAYACKEIGSRYDFNHIVNNSFAVMDHS